MFSIRRRKSLTSLERQRIAIISALLDNYLYQNQAKGFGLKEILWRRVLDVNDRSLRSIVVGLGPKSNGITQESGFDITPA